MSKKGSDKKLVLTIRSEAFRTNKSGTWDMKSPKDYDRKSQKARDRKKFEEYMR